MVLPKIGLTIFTAIDAIMMKAAEEFAAFFDKIRKKFRKIHILPLVFFI